MSDIREKINDLRKLNKFQKILSQIRQSQDSVMDCEDMIETPEIIVDENKTNLSGSFESTSATKHTHNQLNSENNSFDDGASLIEPDSSSVDEEDLENGNIVQNVKKPVINDWQKAFIDAIRSSDAPHLITDQTNKNKIKDNLVLSQNIEKMLTAYVLPAHGDDQNSMNLDSMLDFINLKNTSHTVPKSRFQPNGTLPFLIKDILKIPCTDVFGDVRTMYGKQFKCVMFYGICIPQKCSFRNGKEQMIYHVDDGTAKIEVVFDHIKHNAKLVKTLRSLKEEYHVLQLEEKKTKNSSTLRRKIPFESLSIIYDRIERNLLASRNTIPLMSRVFVIGVPYQKPFRNDLSIYAYKMQVDAGTNTDMEINFKHHLFDMYENTYTKCK